MSKKVTSGKGWSLISEETSQEEIISLKPNQQKYKIICEKRKKGKVVTVISGLVLSLKDAKALAKKLKVTCGTGGTVVDNEIELQGECSSKVDAWMQKNGWGC